MSAKERALIEKTREELIAEIAELRDRLEEAESAVHAIRGGEVDAFVVYHPEGEVVYTLERAELLQQLRLVTDALPALIAYLDRDACYLFTNREYEAWFGSSIQDLQGRHMREVLGDEGYEAEREAMASALAGHKTHSESWVEFPSRGSRCLCSTYVPHIHGGEVQGVVSMVEDITERRRAETGLLRAKEVAEAANRAKDQFLATLSHELRTPLTPVLAVAGGLERDETLPAEVRQGLAVIRRNVELEARLIDDLLDLTRIARGKLDLSVQRVDLAEVIDVAFQACCSQDATDKGLQVRKELAAGDHKVWADPGRLTQVFWNLLSNAVKFTPPGGTITLRTRQENSKMIVEVADTGIGIEDGLIEKIFEAFDQGRPDTMRRFGGLGLGLAISRAIVELHKGSLTAASEGPGHGALFSVALPLPSVPIAAAPPAGGAESTAADAAADQDARRPLRIFLVEDHADTADAMAHLLRSSGHEVTVAGTVREALDAAAAAHAVPGGGFDLVISDLGLPDGSGLDLMSQLAERYGLKGIALSGYGMEEDVQRSSEAGFAKHVTKPVTFAALESAVQEVAATLR